MNKIKQNKISFTLILSAIVIIFSSLTILSLPVLFNYKSKVTKIEKNFYKSFKIYLNSQGKISYKPFPKPHLLVENAMLNLSKAQKENGLINTSNLKIYITLRDIYLRSFDDLVSTEISNSNLELKFSDIIDLRKHLYQNINKPIILKNCKIFLKNKKDEVVLISPTKKISYKINNKTKIKNFVIDGEIFGLTFKSDWKRSYLKPNTILHNINIFNPNIEIKNIVNFDNKHKFTAKSEIAYFQDKLNYKINFDKNKINISSPNKEKTNFNLESKIQLKPFYFEGDFTIKNKKVENIVDNILLNLLFYDENFLGNLNGILKIKFKQLKNKLIKNGETEFVINEKKIILRKAIFDLDKIGKINTNISFIEDKGEIKFISKNQLNIDNHIEFAKIFQLGSKKVKNIKQINFDLEKNVGEVDFIIKNVKINNIENNQKSDEIYLINNIHNLRSYLRKVLN